MESIGIEDFIIVYLKRDGASGNLFFADGNGQNLFIRESELRQHDDVPVIAFEALVLIENHDIAHPELKLFG